MVRLSGERSKLIVKALLCWKSWRHPEKPVLTGPRLKNGRKQQKDINEKAGKGYHSIPHYNYVTRLKAQDLNDLMIV